MNRTKLKYPNHAIQTIDTSWNVDKKIEITGQSRQRTLMYKQAGLENMNLKSLIRGAWGFSMPLGVAFLTWFFMQGGNTTVLQEQIQQNGAHAIKDQFLAENKEVLPEAPVPDENLRELPENQASSVDIHDWVDNIIVTESSNNPEAVSPVGALGLMQLMPPTWAEWSKKVLGKELPRQSAFDPDLNRQVGTAYLEWIQNTLRNWMGSEPSIEHILAANNGGIGRLRSVGFDVSKMPSETQNYVKKITKLSKPLRQAATLVGYPVRTNTIQVVKQELDQLLQKGSWYNLEEVIEWVVINYPELNPNDKRTIVFYLQRHPRVAHNKCWRYVYAVLR